MDINVAEIVDYVENFDRKGIQYVFLSTPTRSGSVLFHSLLDHHPQILHVPLHMYYYFDWEYHLRDEGPDTLIDAFFAKSHALIPSLSGLGEKGDQTLHFEFDKVSRIMKAALPQLTSLDRKKLILLVHFAYGKHTGQDLSRVRMILHHHHSLTNIFGYMSYVTAVERRISEEDLEGILQLTPARYVAAGDPFVETMLADFPQAKFLVTIRHPMPATHAFLEYLKSLPDYRADLSCYALWSYLALMGFYSLVGLGRLLGEQLRLVRFEDLHGDTEKTMREMAEYLGIDYDPCLLESTFAGLPWSGAGVTRNNEVIRGTSPAMLEKENKWKTGWDTQTQALYKTLTNPLCQALGYPAEPVESGPENFSLTAHELEILQEYPRHIAVKMLEVFVNKRPDALSDEQFQWVLSQFTAKITFWKQYPEIRGRLIHYLLGAGMEVEEQPVSVSR